MREVRLRRGLIRGRGRETEKARCRVSPFLALSSQIRRKTSTVALAASEAVCRAAP